MHSTAPRGTARKRSLIGVACWLAAHAAGAQNVTGDNAAAGQPAVASTPVNAIEIVGQQAGRRSVSIDSTALPSSVTVIDQKEIECTNTGRDIANLLRRVPGVMAHNLNQGDTGTSIKMRGFLTSTHGADAAVTVDGMAQNVPSSVINHGMNDLSWLSPDMIERIEVIKGPFSALYGDQNRSGAVNIVTRSRSDSSIAVSAGSFGARRAVGTYSGHLGPVQTLFVADRFQQDGYRDNSDMTRTNVMAKGSFVASDGNVWALRANYQNSDWNGAGFLNINRVRSGQDSKTARDPLGPPLFGNAERTGIVGTLTPAGDEAGLHATVFYEDYKRRRVVAANLTDLNVQDDDRHDLGARALYNFAFGNTAALVVGADTRKDRGDGIVRRWVAGTPSANYATNQDLDLLTYGLFAQGQVQLPGAVKLVGGVRRDSFDYDIRNRKLPAASVAYEKSVTTPRVGLVWNPIHELELFANQGQGFRSPSQAELSPSGAVGPLGAAGGASNSGVLPSKVKSYDVGFNASPSRRWQMSAAAFHTLNQNEIIQVSPGVFSSVGDTTRDGWEAETRYAVNDAIGVYGSFGKIIKARINNPLPNTASRISVPANTIKGGASLTTPVANGTLLLNADAFYISGIPFFQGTPLALSFSRPYSKYDLRATYSVAQWQVTGTLTLQPHQLSSEVAFGSVAGLQIDPRPRAEGLVSVRYRF